MSETLGITKKETAVSFLERVASGDIRKAFNDYTAKEFHHHNPYFRGDAKSLMLAMEENAEKNPGKIFEVKRSMEEGNEVVVHSHVRQYPEDLGAVVIHIFRFENERIVELWDIGQPIPEDMINENGIF